MANAYPNPELELLNTKIKNSIDQTLENIGTDSVYERVLKSIEEKKLQKVETESTYERVLKRLEDKDIKVDAFSNERSYINALPETYKEKTLRYIDVFRDHPEIVHDYIKAIKEWGSEKDAKKAGSTAELLYPNKLLTKVLKDPEYEKDARRFFMIMNPMQGEKIYDLSLRADETGLLKQKEYEDKFSTKILGGVSDAYQGSVREVTKAVARLVDMGLNTQSLAYIEENWPEASKSESALRRTAEGLAEFGIDLWLGGKILKSFGWVAKRAAPGQTKQLVDKLSKTKAKKDKWGRVIEDPYGNIVQTSSIAKRLGFWTLPVKYGLGRTVTSDPDQTSFGEGFGLVTRADTSKMTNREKAVHDLKWKLAHGAEGTALIAGLTVALKGTLGAAGWTAKNVLGPPLKIAGDWVVNPIAKVAASRMTGIPQLVKGIKNAGGFITQKIPPLAQWQFFSIGAGPLRERIMGLADKFLMAPVRTRGQLTKEAKDIMRKGEDQVRNYRKNVDLDLKRIDSSIYKMLKTGFASRLFTQSSAVAGKQYWDDVIRFLRQELKRDQLPAELQAPAQNIRNLIESLSKKIEPYVKSEEVKEEIIKNLGKYLTTSYEIFQGSFKPSRAKIDAAQKYFVGLLQQTKGGKFFNVKEGAPLWVELNRQASRMVDDVLAYGRGVEGTTPLERLNAITALVTPANILVKKGKSLPTVIEELMGKVTDPRAIIVDTVTKQAQLISHLETHKQILKEGLRAGWIVKDPAEWMMGKLGITAPWVGRNLVPIKAITRPSQIDIGKLYQWGTKKDGGFYHTTPEIAGAIASDALMSDILISSTFASVYKPFLAAKTTAQLSKTVLSLMTQTRNFETAAFFSLLNGHIGSQASVLDAMKLTFGEVVGVGGKISPEVMKKKLTEYLKYGVTDSSVVAGEVEAVIGDIVSNRWASTDALFKYLINNPIFRKATEFYQASDNVWKAYGYEFTKSQLLPAIPRNGFTVANARKLGFRVEPNRTVDYTWKDLVSQQYREVFGKRWNPENADGTLKTYAESIKEISGQYIRNVYPNYGMVPNLVKNWRRFPVGNFVAFQSEIIRNLYNVGVYGTREITSSNPWLRQMGARRIMGLTGTMYGFGKGLGLMTGALTNIDEDFIIKYQRFFSPWYDKNSTLYPISKMERDKDGWPSWWTLNFSREQPFEAAQDAFATFVNGMFDPVDKSDRWYAERFFKSFFYDYDEKKKGGFTLLLEPFLTETILGEGLLDITPLDWGIPGARGGKDRRGKIIYDITNDDWDVILAKAAGHLVQTITPTTFVNMGKIMSAYEQEVDRAANRYNTTNEILKLFLGLGAKKENPRNSVTYVISDFSKRVREINNTFKRNAFEPQHLMDNPLNFIEEFEKLQKSMYREKSRVAEFLSLLEEMNIPYGQIRREFKDRQNFGNMTMGFLKRNAFDAAKLPPREMTAILPRLVIKLNNAYAKEIADGTRDAFTLNDIYPVQDLQGIIRKWMNVPLGLSDEELEEYFMGGKKLPDDKTSMIMPPMDITEQKQVASVKPQVPLNAANVSAEVIASKPDQNVVGSTGLTATETAWLSNEEKAMRLKQKGLA